MLTGDGETVAGFLNLALDYLTQFVLSLFDDPLLDPDILIGVFNLCQIGIINPNLVSGEIGIIDFTQAQVDYIINQIPTTFNRCSDCHSQCTQQLEQAASDFIGQLVEIYSENTNPVIFPIGEPLVVTINAVKPGIIIATIESFLLGISTCFVTSIRPFVAPPTT